jgi:glycosyltransferase involved in cell wall biosynthesis
LLSAYDHLLRATKADCYIFNNQAVEREARHKFPGMGRTAILSAGLDPQAFHPAPKHAPVVSSPGEVHEPATVVFSAYLARENDLQVFLEAMQVLQTRHVAVRGVVIGGPNMTAGIGNSGQPERRITIPENVTFETYDSPAALGKQLRASELFCVPSSWHKAASLYMLEALACGLPVVATQSAGFTEETAAAPGILVVPNAAERLAQTVQQLVEDSAARQLLANMAYSTYTGNYMWYATRASYRSVLASSPFTASPELGMSQEAVQV